MISRDSIYTVLVILLLLNLKPGAQALAEKSAEKSTEKSTEESAPASNLEFESFSAARTDLLSRLGGASKRIWLSTNFLTDAEIVSSLYIAQYRKVQISVLLGKEKAANILSRLGYLKQVNIPVAIKPKAFYPETPTMVLLDDKLYSMNSDLDYLSKIKKFVLKELDGNDLRTFEAAFQEAAQNQETPDVKPLPLVGGQRGRKSRIYSPTTEDSSKGPNKSTSDVSIASPSTESIGAKSSSAGGETGGDGVYRYRRVKDRPAAGVPTKLPKMTLGQELERQRAASSSKEPPAAAGTP